jgi:hypothetical protein
MTTSSTTTITSEVVEDRSSPACVGTDDVKEITFEFLTQYFRLPLDQVRIIKIIIFLFSFPNFFFSLFFRPPKKLGYVLPHLRQSAEQKASHDGHFENYVQLRKKLKKFKIVWMMVQQILLLHMLN